MRRLFPTLIAAGCSLALVTNTASAQRHGGGGHGGGGWGGHSGGGGSNWGGGWSGYSGWGGYYGSPSFSIGYNSYPYYGGYGYRGYGYNNYPYYSSYGYGYPSYSYGYSYPNYSYGYSPQYYSTPDTAVYNNPQPNSSVSAYGNPGMVQSWVKVILPDPMARLTVQGQPSQQTGNERSFYSTPLEPGKTYAYTFQATWMQNGQEVTREKRVDIVAGQNTIVNFMDANNAAPGGETMPPNPNAGATAINTVPNVASGPIVGDVVRIEGEQVFITDNKGGQERAFRLAPNGRLTIGGNQAQFNSLKPGMRVSITTQPNSTGGMATSIQAAELQQQ